jgi:hypothetical protein
VISGDAGVAALCATAKAPNARLNAAIASTRRQRSRTHAHKITAIFAKPQRRLTNIAPIASGSVHSRA